MAFSKFPSNFFLQEKGSMVFLGVEGIVVAKTSVRVLFFSFDLQKASHGNVLLKISEREVEANGSGRRFFLVLRKTVIFVQLVNKMPVKTF